MQAVLLGAGQEMALVTSEKDCMLPRVAREPGMEGRKQEVIERETEQGEEGNASGGSREMQQQQTRIIYALLFREETGWPRELLEAQNSIVCHFCSVPVQRERNNQLFQPDHKETEPAEHVPLETSFCSGGIWRREQGDLSPAPCNWA